MIRSWLVGIFFYAKESWRDGKELRRQEAEAEYNRQNPLYGPPTMLQASLYSYWSKEIMTQLLPVLRFEQFAKEHHEDV